jgi:hypothetical protein
LGLICGNANSEEKRRIAGHISRVRSGDEGGIKTVPSHQFVMTASLDDLALIHNQNNVGVANRAQTVRNDNPGGFQRREIPVHLLFGDRVQFAGCFIQQKNGGVVNQGSGDGDSLALPAG